MPGQTPQSTKRKAPPVPAFSSERPPKKTCRTRSLTRKHEAEKAAMLHGLSPVEHKVIAALNILNTPFMCAFRETPMGHTLIQFGLSLTKLITNCLSTETQARIHAFLSEMEAHPNHHIAASLNTV